MKRLLALAVLAAAPLFTALTGSALADVTPATAKAAKKYQLVFHVSENNPAQWQLTLNNAFAFQRNVGADNANIEIVAIGPGLNMLKLDSKATNGITSALDHNIDVVACGETMHATQVKKEDLIGGVRVVPGGLIEIVQRQQAGWSYVRP